MKIKIKKDGLTGDELATVEDLEKRFTAEEVVTPEDIKLQLREAGLIGEDGKPLYDLKKMLGDENTEGSLRSILKAQGVALAEFQTNQQEQPKDMSLRSQVKAWQERADVKAAIAAIKSGTQAAIPAFELDIRAIATMTTAKVNAGGSVYIPQAQLLAGVNDLIRIAPSFWDYLPKGRATDKTIAWINKANKEGNAQFIGEGVLKPLASFELVSETSTAKKVAERMKMSTETLEDIDQFATLVEQELEYEVKMAVNTAILSATGSATSPAGVFTYASAYTLTTIQTSNPNNFDAIRAAAAQIRSLHFKGQLVAFVNPIEGANMEMTKAQDSGVYMLPPFTSADGVKISGVTVVEDENIPVGKLLILDMTKLKILIYKDFTIAWGWENDDFSKNLVTVIGEMRLHQYVNSLHLGAFIYDDFADIKALIDSAAE